MKTKFNNRHGKSIIVQIDNQDVGSELVFMAHGLGGFKEQKHIQAFADAFIKAGCIVVRWDASNTIGESEGKIEDATLTNYYEDFEDVVKWSQSHEWYKEPFVTSGHSLGSACCVLFATQYPNKVKALAPASLFLSGKTYYESQNKNELKEWKEKGYILQESSSKPGVMKKLNWSLMEDLLTYELFDNAGKISKPTLLMVGSEDTGTPPEDQRLFLDKLATKDKEIHIIEGAPHTFKEKKHLKEIETIMYKWAKKIKRLGQTKNKVRKTQSAGGVVLNSRGKVLVVDQKGTSWSLPKGHIENGEKRLEAAKREIYEESGITDLEFVKELGTYQRYRIPDDGKGEDKSEIKTIFMFLFKTKEVKLKPVDDHNPQAKWLDRKKVADKLTHPKDKEFFLSVINEL